MYQLTCCVGGRFIGLFGLYANAVEAGERLLPAGYVIESDGTDTAQDQAIVAGALAPAGLTLEG